MNAKKVFGYIAAMLILLPMMLGALGTRMTAHAADPPADPTTADVTLHKVVFEDEFPDGYPRQNTGEEMNDFEGEPLEGATFEVYDVTAQYYAYIEAGMTPEAALEEIEADALSGLPDYLASATAVGSGTTNSAGEVKFTALPLQTTIGEDPNARTVDAVYLFIETDAPADIKQRAMPIALAMPIYKLNAEGKPIDELNTDIHLYPPFV